MSGEKRSGGTESGKKVPRKWLSRSHFAVAAMPCMIVLVREPAHRLALGSRMMYALVLLRLFEDKS